MLAAGVAGRRDPCPAKASCWRAASSIRARRGRLQRRPEGHRVGLLGDAADAPFRARVDGVAHRRARSSSSTAGCRRLPRWTAVPDADWPEPGAGVDHRRRWTTPSRRSRNALRGNPRHPGSPSCTSRPPTTPRSPRRASTRCPAFVQYAPLRLWPRGTWDSSGVTRSASVGSSALVGRTADIDDVRRARGGPRPARHRVGGSASPAATSSRASASPTRCGERRLHPRAPGPGVYLCGAATHPGGSVIGSTAVMRRWPSWPTSTGPGERVS